MVSGEALTPSVPGLHHNPYRHGEFCYEIKFVWPRNRLRCLGFLKLCLLSSCSCLETEIENGPRLPAGIIPAVPGVRFTKGKSAGFLNSRQVSRSRDWSWKLPDGSELWQGSPYYCGVVCPISEPPNNSYYLSRGLDTCRDLSKPGHFSLVKRTPGRTISYV